MSTTARAVGLPRGAAEVLATSTHWQVRQAVARNPSTPADVVDSLLLDRTPVVRAAAYRHTRTTSILDVTESVPVQRGEAIARNPLTGAPTLERLLNHGSTRVVRAAMSHPSAPSEEVRKAAGKYPTKELFNTGSTTYVAAGVGLVMRHHPCVAHAWYVDPDSVARRALMKDPRFPAELVERLPQTVRGGWGRALGFNPNIPRGDHPATRGAERDQLEALLAGRTTSQMVQDPTGRLQIAAAPSATLHQEVAQAGLGKSEIQTFVQHTSTLRGQDQVPADILAHLVDQGGYRSAAQAAGNMGITRVKSATELSEVLDTYDHSLGVDIQMDPDEAGKMLAATFRELGDDKDAWESYVALGINWQRPLAELGEAVRLVQT